MSRKYELSDIQSSQIASALQLKIDSLKRALSKQITGSAVHKAIIDELREYQSIQLIFSI